MLSFGKDKTGICSFDVILGNCVLFVPLLTNIQIATTFGNEILSPSNEADTKRVKGLFFLIMV